MKALVADDSAVMRKLLSDALNSAGFQEIDEAVDDLQAVEAVAKTGYQLVFIDGQLPERPIIETVQELRAQDKSVPIILVTTQGERRHVIDLLKAGATNYIVKPIESQAAVAKIRELLGQHNTI